jgi:CheY-like chemotaxis protein
VSRPCRILVVEDNADLRENLVEALELDGHEVRWAPDGRRALELLAGDPVPHVAILDMMMPGIDGAELVERIRAQPRLAAVRLVLATGQAPVNGAARVDAVLMKPFGVEQLTQVLERLLAQG